MFVKHEQSLTSEAVSAELWPSRAESSDLCQRQVKYSCFLEIHVTSVELSQVEGQLLNQAPIWGCFLSTPALW